MNSSPTIAKIPVLDPSEDYAWLVRRGLEHVQKLAGRIWTDYNVHDPGVTLLEVLCYALTDIGHRTGFGMADLLALPAGDAEAARRQGFHTAREILTMAPLTVRDHRKALIDLEGIKNAWLHVKDDDLDTVRVLVNRPAERLQYFPETGVPLRIQGLYDVQVEFEDLDRVGNLNSGKVLHAFAFAAASGGSARGVLELRFPSWQNLASAPAAFKTFRRTGIVLAPATAAHPKPVRVRFISGNRSHDTDILAVDLPSALRSVLYATLEVRFVPNPASPGTVETLVLADVPLRAWFHADASRRDVVLDDLKRAIEETSTSGPVLRYHELVVQADRAIARVRSALAGARNLAEDWCTISAVSVEDVSICADLDVDPACDIEAVMAEAYFRIDQHLSPDLRFRSLSELLERGVPVEDIFDGPPLSNGFLDDDEVDATDLKTVIHASDLIALLMAVPGVRAVRNFTMARYDQDGRPLGSAEAWELPVTPRHQPRFHPQASRFWIYKNGLPFQPDADELNDLLQVVRGRAARPKIPVGPQDLPVPTGTARDLVGYFPVQYQLPLAYGVGVEGLPREVGTRRLAQAAQLRAYLAVFEQILVDDLAQLERFADCLAIDPSVDRTVFTRLLGDDILPGVESDVYAGWTAARHRELAETNDAFLDRRNRFLDHMLARFAESFADYAVMLLRGAADKDAARAKLVGAKLDFLKDLPRTTRDRARGFDTSLPAETCAAGSDNAAGLVLRIRRLLGLKAPDDTVFVVEHVLLRPRRANVDPLLPLCPEPGCEDCTGEDPYSFRITVVLCGEGGEANGEIEWRRFAERSIRQEVPAHLVARVCWVGREQLAAFRAAWCAHLAVVRTDPVDPAAFTASLDDLLEVFTSLKSVYPPASLHDCVDGNDENRVFLNQTVITSQADGKASPP